MIHNTGIALQTGTRVKIDFAQRLTKYGEPRGRLLDPVTGEPLAFRHRDGLHEAYGYNPDNQRATPVTFWGDAYIKPGSGAHADPSPWLSLKRYVNGEVFLAEHIGTRLSGTLYLTRVQGLPKFICGKYHSHLNRAYEVIWASTEALRAYCRQYGRHNKRPLLPHRVRIDDALAKRLFSDAQKLSAIAANVSRRQCYEDPRPINWDEIDDLRKRVDRCLESEIALAPQYGHDKVRVMGILFTNALEISEPAERCAREHGIGVYRVSLPVAWSSRPARRRLKERDISVLVEPPVNPKIAV
jgi:hypothetical protein